MHNQRGKAVEKRTFDVRRTESLDALLERLTNARNALARTGDDLSWQPQIVMLEQMIETSYPRRGSLP